MYQERILKLGKFLVAGLSLALSASAVFSQASTGNVKITGMRTGWYSDQVAITISGAVPNPAGCSSPDGFILNTATPGYKTHYAAVLAAISLDRTVEIIVGPSNCVVGRPEFWGIYFK